MADRIDQMLEEWKTDFDNESEKRNELKKQFKTALGVDHRDKAFNVVMNETSKPKQPKLHTVKSEVKISNRVDTQDDAIFNLEFQLESKDERIRDCKIKSGE